MPKMPKRPKKKVVKVKVKVKPIGFKGGSTKTALEKRRADQRRMLESLDD